MKKGFLGIDIDEIEKSGQNNMPETIEHNIKDIAVIGMAVQMPMAQDLDAFWDNINNGLDCMCEIPPAREADFDKYLRYKNIKYNKLWHSDVAWLSEIDGFDYNFFSMSPGEASLIDPHQRIFLETAWQAIEDAGYGGDRIYGTRTGVYVGHTGDRNYLRLIADVQPSELNISVPGNIPQNVAGRVSYLLNLRGPNIVTDTTCSSSLVALHLACQGMRNSECEMALVGGIKLHLAFNLGEEKFAVLSEDGRCRTFDDNSDGIGIGEGAGAVLLKNYSKALEDGDNIYAVIKGSAVNHDGSSIGITAPSPAAQQDVITRAWTDAGIDPRTISYIETHGTGTKLGDPIEIQGIEGAFSRYTKDKQFCGVGSIKTNIGHLDTAAGMAAFIKTVLCIKNTTLPPSIHMNKPNSRIGFESSPVYINTKSKKWNAYKGIRRAGISSFGLGGTNCHVVVEQVKQIGKPQKHTVVQETACIFAISAKSIFSMEQLIDKYRNYLKIAESNKFENICFTSCVGRGHYNYRLAIVADSIEALRGKLNHFDLQSHVDSDDIFYGFHKVVSKERELDDVKVITEQRKKSLNLEAEEELVELVEHKKNCREHFEKLCKLYISGADINWKKLYRQKRLGVEKLPVYPFDEKRCWVNVPDSLVSSEQEIIEPYHSVYWERMKTSDSISFKETKGSILVFLDDATRGKDTARILEKKGWDIVEVEQGECFNENSSKSYTVGNDQQSYNKLMQHLSERNIVKVLYFSCLDGDSKAQSVEDVKQALNAGVLSIFYLSRAITEANIKNEVEIVMLAQYTSEVNGTEPRINPSGAAMFGLGKTISMENVLIKCRCVDIDESTNNEILANELEGTEKYYQVAYRDGIKYNQIINKVDFNKIEDSKVEIKENGVYVIVGGTRGIGLEIAKNLASNKQITLALIGRSPVQVSSSLVDSDVELTDIEKAVRQIKENGSHAQFYSCDVTNEEELSSVLISIRKDLGCIDGIIHCAGVAGNGFLTKKDESAFWEVLKPKTIGTWLLKALTVEDKLDFFVMCSSATYLTSGPGQGDYTAANAYMDTFQAYARKKGIEAVTINWAAWDNIGMDALRKGKHKSIFKKLRLAEALEYFNTVLGKRINALIIGEIDYSNVDIVEKAEIMPLRLHDEIKNRLKLASVDVERQYLADSPKAISEVKLKGRRDNLYTDTEKLVSQAWGEVLGFDEIDIYDTFYELGGDSILAIKIVNRINEGLGIKEEIVEMLRRPTVKEYADYIDTGREKSTSKNKFYETLKAAPQQDYYQLSSAQRRLYIHWQVQEDSTVYNMPSAIAIKGDVSSEGVENAVQQLVERHESLRTSFEFIDGRPVQRIHEKIEFKVEYVDISSMSVQEILKKFVRPFNLSEAPLMRVALGDGGDDNKLLLFDMHHIISDAISINILLRDFSYFYNDSMLVPLEVQYKDFAHWQMNLFTSGAFKGQEVYWQKKLEKLEYTTLQNKKHLSPSLDGARIKIELEKTVFKGIEVFCGRHKITKFVFMLAAFKIALYNETGQGNLSIGIPVSGRNNSLLEKIVGIFLNVLVISTNIQDENDFSQYLKNVEATVMEALDNQEYPYDELFTRLKENSGFMFQGLFSIFFNYLPYIKNKGISLGNASITSLEFEDAVPKYDLTMYIKEMDNSIVLDAVYKKDIYDEQVIEGLLSNYSNVIEKVLANEKIIIKEILLQEDNKREASFEDFDELFENDEFV